MLIEMKVKFLTFDSTSNGFVVLLMDLPNKTGLPIWIGPFEANAIAMKLKKMDSHRPMTHDLMNDILKILDVEVTSVEICDLRNNTFFASIHLIRNGQRFVVDARPSDGIALALRANAQIFVDDKVLEKSRTIEFGAKAADLDKLKEDKLMEFLENLSPEEFGKYKM